MPKIQPTDVLVNETLKNAGDMARRLSESVPAYYRSAGSEVVRRGSTTLRFVPPPSWTDDTDVVDGWEN